METVIGMGTVKRTWTVIWTGKYICTRTLIRKCTFIRTETVIETGSI